MSRIELRAASTRGQKDLVTLKSTATSPFVRSFTSSQLPVNSIIQPKSLLLLQSSHRVSDWYQIFPIAILLLLVSIPSLPSDWVLIRTCAITSYLPWQFPLPVQFSTAHNAVDRNSEAFFGRRRIETPLGEALHSFCSHRWSCSMWHSVFWLGIVPL